MRQLASHFALWLLVGSASRGVAAETPGKIAGILLPSRSPEVSKLRARVAAITSLLAERRGLVLAPRTGEIAIEPLTTRADEQLNQAHFDDAARFYEDAIREGTRALGRLRDDAPLVHAHLARAELALAQKDNARAEQLLARLVRFDRSLSLTPEEDRPRLRATLTKVRSQAGPPTVEDLVDLCKEVDVLLVGHTEENGQLAVLLVEGCRETKRVRVDSTSDSDVVSQLSPTTARPSSFSPAGLATVLVGGATLVVGLGLWGSAYTRYDELDATCGGVGNCDRDEVAGLRAREAAGFALLGIGAGVTLIGAITWGIQSRNAHRLAK